MRGSLPTFPTFPRCVMLSGMDIRVELYASDGRYVRTERYFARNEVEAITAARELLAGHGLYRAHVYRTDGMGGIQHLAKVWSE